MFSILEKVVGGESELEGKTSNSLYLNSVVIAFTFFLSGPLLTFDGYPLCKRPFPSFIFCPFRSLFCRKFLLVQLEINSC